MNELKQEDKQFVENKIDTELKLDDITKTVKVQVPVTTAKGNGKKPKKRMRFLDFMRSYEDARDDLRLQVRHAGYIQNIIWARACLIGIDSWDSTLRAQQIKAVPVYSQVTFEAERKGDEERVQRLRTLYEELLVDYEELEKQEAHLIEESHAMHRRVREDAREDLADLRQVTMKAKEDDIETMKSQLRRAEQRLQKKPLSSDELAQAKREWGRAAYGSAEDRR